MVTPRYQTCKKYKVGQVIVAQPKTIKTADKKIADAWHKIRTLNESDPHPEGLNFIQEARFWKRREIKEKRLYARMRKLESYKQELQKTIDKKKKRQALKKRQTNKSKKGTKS